MYVYIYIEKRMPIINHLLFQRIGSSSKNRVQFQQSKLRSQRMSRWFITIKKTTAAPSPVKFTKKNIAQIKFLTQILRTTKWVLLKPSV